MAWYNLANEGFLLPPREVAFALLLPAESGDSGGGDQVLAPESLSFQTLATLGPEAPPPRIATILAAFKGPRNPWNLTHVFVDGRTLRSAADAMGLGVEGAPKNAHHLWRPTPELLCWCDRIEDAVGTAGRGKARCPGADGADGADGVPLGSCLDLGCGAGRDAAFLALRGWAVLAVDNMPKALARARLLAARCRVGGGATGGCTGGEGGDRRQNGEEARGGGRGGRLQTAVVDVRRNPADLLRALTSCDAAARGGAIGHLELAGAEVPGSSIVGSASSSEARGDSLGTFAGGVDLVVVSRFFYRPLLRVEPEPNPWAVQSLVAPGGVVFWHHFRAGVESHPLGHPSNPEDIVSQGELQAAFEGWEILLNDETNHLPDGRPMVTFIAQRPL